MKNVFAFVNVENPGDKANAQQRRQIHVQAMRSFRRRQRLQNVEAHEKAASASFVGQKEEPERKPLLDKSDFFGARQIDPFKALPLGFEQHQDLLFVFQTRCGPMMLPENKNNPSASWANDWLFKAVHNPMMLEAICSHSATLLDEEQKSGTSPRSLQLQNRAIQSLSASLKDGPCDEAIGTVLMLIGNTLLEDKLADTEVHMLALERMVAMRGGMESMSSEVQMGILWQLAAFYAMKKIDRYPFILDIPPVPAAEPMQQLSILLAKCRELTHLRHMLESAHEVDQYQMRQFSDDRSIMECQLGRLRHELQEHQPAGNPCWILLSRAMCLAAMFYSFAHLRRFMIEGPNIEGMMNELVDTLTKAWEAGSQAVIKPNADDRRAALWATCIARRFAQTRHQVQLTGDYARRLAQSVNCSSADQLRELLSHHVWDGYEWDSTILDLMLELQISLT